MQSSLSTSTLDVSRGGFSGGNFNLSAASGSNFRTRGTSFVFNAPALEWTDRAAQAVGTEYTNLSLGGVVSGPISYNKSFFSLSYQFGRNSRDNATLLNTNALGLLTAGVAYDSAQHLLGILSQRGLSPTAGGLHQSRLSDNGSVFGSVTYSPPTSSSGQTIGVTYNANWSRQDPAGGSATSLASASGDRTNWGGGLQARHTVYIGNTLSETQASASLSRNYGTPFLVLPAGNVRVSSDLPDGASGVSSLTFGGGQGFGSTSESRNAGLQNTLSWFDDANKHRLKLETELNYSGSAVNQSFNLLGTFSFNSLSDLANGVPASFTRSLSAYDRTINLFVAGASIGDSYRRNQDLQIQYGVRVDGAHYATAPIYNPDVDRLFGLRNDHVPNPIAISPRIGFQKTLGQAPEIFAFTGAQRAPRAIVRGERRRVHEQSERRSHLLRAGQHRTGVRRAADLVRRTRGADSELVGVRERPWLHSHDLRRRNSRHAIRDVRAERLSRLARLPHAALRPRERVVERQPVRRPILRGSIRDLLAQPGPAALVRPQLQTLDAILARRRPPGLRAGREHRSDHRLDRAGRRPRDDGVHSRLRDALGSSIAVVADPARRSLRFRTARPSSRWTATYTYLHTREQVSGFQSTAGNPLDVVWATNGQGPHQISYNLRYNLFNAAAITWNGSLPLGEPRSRR